MALFKPAHVQMLDGDELSLRLDDLASVAKLASSDKYKRIMRVGLSVLGQTSSHHSNIKLCVCFLSGGARVA